MESLVIGRRWTWQSLLRSITSPLITYSKAMPTITTFTKNACFHWWWRPSRAQKRPVLHMGRLAPVRPSLWWVPVTGLSLDSTYSQPTMSSICWTSTRIWSSTCPFTRFIAVNCTISSTTRRSSSVGRTPNRTLTWSDSLRSPSPPPLISWLSLALDCRAEPLGRQARMLRVLDHTLSCRCSWSIWGRLTGRSALSISRVVREVRIPWTRINKQRWMELRSTSLSSRWRSASVH